MTAGSCRDRSTRRPTHTVKSRGRLKGPRACGLVNRRTYACDPQRQVDAWCDDAPSLCSLSGLHLSVSFAASRQRQE